MNHNEIQKRAVEYRRNNNINTLLLSLENLLQKVPEKDNILSISIIDNAYGVEAIEFAKQMSQFSLQTYQPDYYNILKEVNSLTNRLCDIWENDPEHIRHSSKFFDRRTLSQSQEYYDSSYLPTINLITKNNKWVYKFTATLCDDYIKGIISQCIYSNIVLLPVGYIEWLYNRQTVFNFFILFNAMKGKHVVLWLLFMEEEDKLNNNSNSKIILEDIRCFSDRLFKKVGFYFDLIPYSIVVKDKGGNYDIVNLLSRLDSFANKYITMQRV